MATQKQLREIERALGFRYPESFVSTIEGFSALLGTDDFRHAFPRSRLLSSASEITAARENIPGSLFPFMSQEQASWQDTYAFDVDSDGPEFRVVVWADHAIVVDWESFPVFLHWAREFVAKHGTAT